MNIVELLKSQINDLYSEKTKDLYVIYPTNTNNNCINTDSEVKLIRSSELSSSYVLLAKLHSLIKDIENEKGLETKVVENPITRGLFSLVNKISRNAFTKTPLMEDDIDKYVETVLTKNLLTPQGVHKGEDGKEFIISDNYGSIDVLSDEKLDRYRELFPSKIIEVSLSGKTYYFEKGTYISASHAKYFK